MSSTCTIFQRKQRQKKDKGEEWKLSNITCKTQYGTIVWEAQYQNLFPCSSSHFLPVITPNNFLTLNRQAYILFLTSRTGQNPMQKSTKDLCYPRRRPNAILVSSLLRLPFQLEVCDLLSAEGGVLSLLAHFIQLLQTIEKADHY